MKKIFSPDVFFKLSQPRCSAVTTPTAISLLCSYMEEEHRCKPAYHQIIRNLCIVGYLLGVAKLSASMLEVVGISGEAVEQRLRGVSYSPTKTTSKKLEHSGTRCSGRQYEERGGTFVAWLRSGIRR